MPNRKQILTGEEQKRVEPFVNFFVSSSGFQKTLEERFPSLYQFLVGHVYRTALASCEKAVSTLMSAVQASIPTAQELLDARGNRHLLKIQRDRFRKNLMAAYDKHFPRAGGRPTDFAMRHQAAVEKRGGATWVDISTKKGFVFADQDKARKSVERDRVILSGACQWLIEICGPGSGAPPEVQEEFAKLSQAVKTPKSPR
jgi:hypothetical protein